MSAPPMCVSLVLLSLSPRLLLLLLVRVSSAISKAVGKERMGADQLVLILGYLTISLFRRPVILEIQLFLFLPF